MKFLLLLIAPFLYFNVHAQQEKVLLELGASADKLNASRYSIADKYSANYTVNDLGEGFVLSFDRTFAYFNNEMDLQWKTTLPKYVKQGPTPVVIGDAAKTFVIDFSPSYLAFNSMEVKEINNQTGAVETYELIWKGNEKNFADYNYHNGVVSILFVTPTLPKHTYRLMTIENKKLTDVLLDLPMDESDKQYVLTPTYQGDYKSGATLNLTSQYTYDDKKAGKKVVVYKTLSLAPTGKILSSSKRSELDVTDLGNFLWYSKVPLQFIDVDGQRYFVGQMHKKSIPQGWIFGTVSATGEFNIIKKHVEAFGSISSSLPQLSYLPSSKTFVVQCFYFAGSKDGRLHRYFFDVTGKVICEDDVVVDPDLVGSSIFTANTATPSYLTRKAIGNCATLPENLSYFNLVEEYSKKKPAKAIHFHAIDRGNSFIVVIIDPNTGKVTGRKTS